MPRARRNLVYTVAIDRPGQTGHRNMAKMLVSSLLRTRFSGDIMVMPVQRSKSNKVATGST